MDYESQRRQAQLDFVQSEQDIIVGDPNTLPMSIEQLQATTTESPYVVESFSGGLTAFVHHIHLNGRDWNLKLKRPTSLVKNVDGQTSFLNEVQRRRDFQALKQDPQTARAFKPVVNTHYASYKQGIILSPWIEGELNDSFTEYTLSQILMAGVNFELNGFIEWDLCPGNIINDGQDAWLFDFGYCYPFDPLTQFNSNGLKDPLFHSVERFETRNFFAHLLQLEDKGQADEASNLFELEKRIAYSCYQYKFSELKRRGASSKVLSWLESQLLAWQQALSAKSALEELMIVEGYRSHLLDLYDDLHGQSCTPMTLRRLDRVEQHLTEHFALLIQHNSLFFGDENKSQQQLLDKLSQHRRSVVKYQI